jgi:hypothetical protein
MGKTLLVQARSPSNNTVEYMTNVDNALCQMFPAYFKRNGRKLEKNVRGYWEVVIDQPEFELVVTNWLSSQFQLTIAA